MRIELTLRNKNTYRETKRKVSIREMILVKENFKVFSTSILGQYIKVYSDGFATLSSGKRYYVVEENLKELSAVEDIINAG